MTLPLIYALNQATKKERDHIINIVKRHNEDPVKVAEVIDFVRQSGGLAYSENAMRRYRSDAIDLLNEFPESDVRTSLEQLVMFVTERKK